MPEITPNRFAPRRNDLGDWLQFVIAESHVLTEAPQLLFQQAFNFPGDSAPVRAARKRLGEGGETRPWLRRVNKRGGRSPCLLTLTGHEDRVNFCRFSSDGSSIVTASADWTLKRWDASSGRELSSLRIGYDPAACDLAPDSLRVIITYGHRWWKDTNVIDVGDGQTIFSVYSQPEPEEGPGSLRWPPDIRLGIGPRDDETYWDTFSSAFSRDGKLLIVVGDWYGKWIEFTKVFDTSTWEEIATFEGPKVNVPYETKRVVISPDSSLLALGSLEGTRILRIVDGSEVTVIPAGGLTSFTSDGRLIIANGDTRTWDSKDEPYVVTVRTWVTSIWKEVEPLKLYVGKAGVGAFSPDARRIVLTCGNTVKVCDLAPNAQPVTLGEHGQYVTYCSFSEDGQRIVTGAWGDVKVWDATATEGSDEAPHGDSINACVYSNDGSLLATSSNDNFAKVWTADGKMLAAMDHNFHVQWAGFSPDASKLVTRSELRLLMLWDPRTGEEIARLGPHCYHPLSCAYSRDGSHIVSGTGVGSYGELWLWDGRTGQFLLSFDGHTSWINHCLFTPDGKRVLSVSDDGTMRLWNVSTGQQIAILIDDRAHILKWDSSPDGTLIAVGMDDHSVKVFDGKTGRSRATLVGHLARVSACEFSSDSKLLATGDSHYDSSVKIWDMDSFEERITLREPHEPNRRSIEQCVFSPDCKLLFTRSSVSSKDHLLVWDIASGLELDRIVGNVGVQGFSPDQSLIMIGRRPLRLWDVNTLTEVARYLSTGARSIAWHPSGSMLAVGELSGGLHVLQLENRAISAPVIEAPPKPRKPRAPRAPRPTDAPRATRTPRAKVLIPEAASDAPASQPRVKRPRKTPSPLEVVIELPAQFEQRSTSTHSIVDVPQAHPAANPNRAMELNLKYQEELKRWNALSWWKRLRIKKPVRPSGI